MFLSDDDLAELTGLVQPAAQRRWLAARGYPFEISSKGRARVLRDVVNIRLGGAMSQAVANSEPRLRFK